MKKIISILLALFLVLTTINLVFLVEIYKDENLNKFFYKGKEISDHYSEKEKIHMLEVKELVINSLLINFLIFLLLIISKKEINLKLAGKITIGLVLLLIFFSLFFQTFFHYFHIISFDSNNWLLPANSKLIQDYPLEYFRNTFLVIITIIAIESIILIKYK